MIWPPEAQATAHYWAATFGGHLAIGVPAWLLVMRPDPWWGVVIVGVVYALCWEVPSLLAWGLTPALAWDSALDAVGVTLGALTAAYLWHGARGQAAAACAGAALVALAGAVVR